jgi:hypothetical protein
MNLVLASFHACNQLSVKYFDIVNNVTLAGLISAWLRIWFVPASVGSSEIGPVGWDFFFWLSHQEKYCNLKQATPLASWLLAISLYLPINAMRVISVIMYKIICKRYD